MVASADDSLGYFVALQRASHWVSKPSMKLWRWLIRKYLLAHLETYTPKPTKPTPKPTYFLTLNLKPT